MSWRPRRLEDFKSSPPAGSGGTGAGGGRAGDAAIIVSGSDCWGSIIQVEVPGVLKNMEPHLAEFFQGMVDKLALNSHKEPPRKMDGLRFLGLMQGEVSELTIQCYEDRSSPNLFLELHDVANYAFLMGLSLRLEQEDLARERQKAEEAAKAAAPSLIECLRMYGLWPKSRKPRESSSN